MRHDHLAGGSPATTTLRRSVFARACIEAWISGRFSICVDATWLSTLVSVRNELLSKLFSGEPVAMN